MKKIKKENEIPLYLRFFKLFVTGQLSCAKSKALSLATSLLKASTSCCSAAFFSFAVLAVCWRSWIQYFRFARARIELARFRAWTSCFFLCSMFIKAFSVGFGIFGDGLASLGGELSVVVPAFVKLCFRRWNVQIHFFIPVK